MTIQKGGLVTGCTYAYSQIQTSGQDELRSIRQYRNLAEE
jgi:hypothetical protein